MLNNIVAGLGALCSAPALIGILLGTIIGLMVGSLPGLNDSITMAVLMVNLNILKYWESIYFIDYLCARKQKYDCLLYTSRCV